jgi:GNAT superfamily N-acetyltransferase
MVPPPANSEITFEPATTDDAPALVDAQVRAFHSDAVTYPGVGEDGPPGYDSEVETLRKIAKHTVYKIVADDVIVGDIVLYESEPGHNHLDILAIVPEHHNHGIGSRALAFIEERHPADVWSLDTPGYATRNQYFYEKHGYIKVGEQTFDGGFTLFNYEKRDRGFA